MDAAGHAFPIAADRTRRAAPDPVADGLGQGVGLLGRDV
jgi:hypothetical protein